MQETLEEVAMNSVSSILATYMIDSTDSSEEKTVLLRVQIESSENTYCTML